MKSLILSNFIIIDSLELNFNRGISVFTGETGAGKSVLLEAISIIVGSKVNKDLIKEGENRSTIIAVFNIKKNDGIKNLLKENEILIENEIIIRRVINENGNSKSFINDTPISVNLLKQIGSLLIEIHGQFDNQKLLNSDFHINLLDGFIEKQYINSVEIAFNNYISYKKQYDDLKEYIENLEKEKEYLSYILKELEEADIKENEEIDLLNKRAFCLEYDKIYESIKFSEDILNYNENGILSNLNKVISRIEKLKESYNSNKTYHDLCNLLNSSYSNLIDCVEIINDFKLDIGNYNLNIDQIEERLILIRTLAKKHKVNSNELPLMFDKIREKITKLEDSYDKLENLQKEKELADNKFKETAKQLSLKRDETAKKLDNQINKELLYLKLPNAKFYTKIISSIDNNGYSKLGFDKVVFQVKTNLEGDFKDLNKIASGGEISRFMLAIKVVMAKNDTIDTMIFDEIDVGVGGDIAHNIGMRLLLLSKFMQVIVVTHSHQIAALGQTHYKVEKYILNKSTKVSAYELSLGDRVNELARMISSDKISKEAKIIALDLIEKSKNYE